MGLGITRVEGLGVHGLNSGASLNFNTSFSDINTGLFGQDTTTKGAETRDLKRTETLEIDDVALFKMLDDALSGVSGLEAIFGQEAGSGIFDSSGAKAGAGDLIAKIAGELAKVTATKVGTETGTINTETSSESSGIIDSVLGFF